MKNRLCAIALVTVICFSNSALAFYGTRPMGMGGAFTAIADDANAAYWNPAGLAINPGINLSGNYKLNNRNQVVGDNTFAIKGCFEIGMDPFAWVLGVGAVSYGAYQGAKYLSDQGVVKKNWGRDDVTKIDKEEPMAESVKEEVEQKQAAGQEVPTVPISRRDFFESALKQLGKGTIFVGDKFADKVLDNARIQTNTYIFISPLYQPNYYRPNYWDNRYAYETVEITPAGKAQFGAGFSWMTDNNQAKSQNTNWYSFSLASGYQEAVALGANINIYDIELTNFSPHLRGMGAGLDVGGLLRFSDKLTFGLVAKELLTTDINFGSGITRTYHMQVNAGASLKPLRQVTVALDMHNIFGQNNENSTMHYGVEVKPVYGLAFRAGLSDKSKTAGMSVGIGQFILDYAYLGGEFNRTQIVGVTWAL